MNKGIIIAIVAVVLVVGAVAFMNSNNMNETEQAQQTNQEQSGDSMMMADEQEGVTVGGALMTPNKDIVDNAVNSNDHTTLVAAVQAAGLVETLKGEGPFTVFAPTNAAFDKLPEGTVDTLLLPENKDTLTGILTYHVVPGEYTSSDISDGMTLTTVQGEDITLMQKDGQWWIEDAKGGMSMITIADVISSNGVTHVVDTVLMPAN